MNFHNTLFTKLNSNFKIKESFSFEKYTYMFSASCLLPQGILLKATGAWNTPFQLRRTLLCDQKEEEMWKKSRWSSWTYQKGIKQDFPHLEKFMNSICSYQILPFFKNVSIAESQHKANKICFVLTAFSQCK